MICPVTICDKPVNDNYSKGYTVFKWEPIHIKDLKYVKEARKECLSSYEFSICEAVVKYMVFKI